MSDEIEVPESSLLTAFIPAFIDDYGFTPEEFRVFCRIMRRSVKSTCFESIPNMGLRMGMAESIVRRSIRILQTCKAIQVSDRPGKSQVIIFNTCEKWEPRNMLPEIRERVYGRVLNKDRERKLTRIGNDTGIGNDTAPLSEMIHEGISLKGIPLINIEDVPPNGVTPQSVQPKKSDLTLEQKQIFTNAKNLLPELIGAVPDWGAQTKALRWMVVNGATFEQIKRGLVRQCRESEHGTKFRASFLTLQSKIFLWATTVPTVKPLVYDVEQEAREYARRFAD